MTTKYYKNIEALKSIDDLIVVAEHSLTTDHTVYTASSDVPKSLKKSLNSVASLGAAGTSKLGTAGVTSNFIGATGTIGVGSLLTPFVIPAAILIGIVFLIFKNKKNKELREQMEFRLKKAVAVQNDIIRKLKLYIQQLEELTDDLMKENMKLHRNVDELTAVNEALMNEINKNDE